MSELLPRIRKPKEKDKDGASRVTGIDLKKDDAPPATGIGLERDDAPPVIGIDLGTTYSRVAVWRKGQAEIVFNSLSGRTTPSCVAFTERGRLIGSAAMTQAAMNPTNTIFDIRRLIGRQFTDPFVQSDIAMWPFKVIEGSNNKPIIVVNQKSNEKQIAPELISSMVITKMKEIAEDYLGTKVMNAVITVPAYFNNSQRQATKAAASIAGLNLIGMVSDSVAAATAYGLNKMIDTSRMKTVLVFDLGSGSLDVSLITIEKGVIIKVKAVAGDTHLGGNDFDNKMIDHFVEEFKKKNQMDIKNNPRALSKLRVACEKAKRTLSTITETKIEIDNLYESIDFQSTISRENFEELNKDYFNRCIKLVKNCLSGGKMQSNGIHDVILVGGSTRIPMLQQMLKTFFHGKELYESINPDEVVACGAAIHAAALTVKQNNIALQNLMLQNVLEVNPMSVRLESRGNNSTGRILSNVQIPLERMINFTTTEDNQTSVRIKVSADDGTRVTENNLLGEFNISGLPSAPKGKVGIGIFFHIDAYGIYHAIAHYAIMHCMDQVVITNDGISTDEEIEKMVEAAESFRVQDEKYKKTATAKNDYEKCVYEMLEFVKSKKISSTLAFGMLSEDITNEISWMKGCGPSIDQASEFEERMKRLQHLRKYATDKKRKSNLVGEEHKKSSTMDLKNLKAEEYSEPTYQYLKMGDGA